MNAPRSLTRRLVSSGALLSGGVIALVSPLLTAETAALVLGLLMIGAGVQSCWVCHGSLTAE